MSTSVLNSLLLNDDPTKVFTLKVPESENVSFLKELIKVKKARQLAHLDPTSSAKGAGKNLAYLCHFLPTYAVLIYSRVAFIVNVVAMKLFGWFGTDGDRSLGCQRHR